MDPNALAVVGSTQPEVFRGTVELMVRMLQADPEGFWLQSVADDGPVEVWELQGDRYLYNGNHRFHAAVQAGVDIPDFALRVIDRTGTNIPTFTLDQIVWLAGLK